MRSGARNLALATALKADAPPSRRMEVEHGGKAGMVTPATRRPPLDDRPHVPGWVQLGSHLHRSRHNDTFHAWCSRTQARVLVKAVRGDRVHEPAPRRRLASEHEALARVHTSGFHPNIVRALWSAGLRRDARGPRRWPALGLEMLDGPSLRELLRAGSKLDLADWRNLARDLASALRRVHACGLVHADVKPANVLFNHGRFVLVDFDLARRAGTQLARGVGTRLYTAPELAANGVVSPAADAWSLGVVLHQAATGVHPFARMPGRPQLTLRAAPLTRVAPGFPRHLALVVDAMLDPDASSRPDLAELDATAAMTGRHVSGNAVGLATRARLEV